jgi:hypothetical protein
LENTMKTSSHTLPRNALTRAALRRNDKRAVRAEALRQLARECRHEAACQRAEWAGWSQIGFHRTSGTGIDRESIGAWEYSRGAFRGADVAPVRAALVQIRVYSGSCTWVQDLLVQADGLHSWVQSFEEGVGNALFNEDAQAEFVRILRPIAGSVDGLEAALRAAGYGADDAAADEFWRAQDDALQDFLDSAEALGAF